MPEIRIGNNLTYIDLAKSAYENIILFSEELDVGLDKLEEIDQKLYKEQSIDLHKSLSSTLKQINKTRLELKQNAITVIVFSALFFEAYIYDYGTRKIGTRFVKKHLDKLDPLSKIVVTMQLVLNKPFPRSDNIYNRIKKIIVERNKLVHYKSYTKFFEHKKDYILYKEEEINNYIKNGKEAFETLQLFVEFIKDFDSEEYNSFGFQEINCLINDYCY